MIENLLESRIDRRSFLKGSAMFAAAVGISMALPAFAQEPQEKKPDEKDTKEDNAGKKDDRYEKKLVDSEGRVYRVCPQCGYNMYKQKNLWVCENCGYSYAE